jgi:DNA-binding IclR family transcriptional regulator
LTLDPSLNALQVAEKLDLSEKTARRFIADMKQMGYLASKPVTYSITEYGLKRLHVKPKASPERVAKIVAQRRQKRELSISGIPNSVFALGGM